MDICSRLFNELAPAWQYAEAKETFAVYFLVVDAQCLKKLSASVLEPDDGVLTGTNHDNVLIEQALVLLAYHHAPGPLLGTIFHTLHLAIDHLGRRGKKGLVSVGFFVC